MYKIIAAEEKHLDQIVPLIASTGYWVAAFRNNVVGLHPLECIRKFLAKPYLPFTYIIVNTQDNHTVLGVLVCASKKEIYKVPDFSIYFDPRVANFFKNFHTFEIAESYHVSFLAIAKQARCQGLGKKLMEFAEAKGKKEGYDTLSLYTINCSTSALKLYFKMGMMIIKAIPLSDTLPFSVGLYLEKNERLTASSDYFETQAYEKLIL